MFSRSLRITPSMPSCWTLTATRVPSCRVAACTWAMVAVASGCGSMWANSISTGAPSSLSSVRLTVLNAAGGQASKALRRTRGYWGGNTSALVAKTWPTFR